MRKFGPGFVALIVLLGSKIGGKLIPILFKLVKGAKVGKVGLAGASAASYTYLFTWQFALLIMVAILVHEYGHVWAMKRCGLRTKGVYFIPFLGAMAVTDEEFGSRENEFYIAIMGPIWGFALTLVAAFVYFYTENTLFAAAAGWMALLNLFNLLPVNPLDGGRIMKSIMFSVHKKAGLVFLIIGLIGSVVIAWYAGLGLFVFLLIIGGIELLLEFRRRLAGPPQMVGSAIAWSFIAYVVLAGSLWGVMSYMNHVPEVSLARELLMH